MSEDTPLYGEQSPSTKIFLLVAQIALGAFCLFSIIVGIVFGIKREGQHIMLCFVVLDIAVLTWLFFRWYSKDSIDPKYRWLVVGFTITLLWTCITLNAYAWYKKPDPGAQCGLGQGFYSTLRKQCLTLPSNTRGFADCTLRGMCFCLTQHTPASKIAPEAWAGVCRNCTLAPCPGIRP